MLLLPSGLGGSVIAAPNPNPNPNPNIMIVLALGIGLGFELGVDRGPAGGRER